MPRRSGSNKTQRLSHNVALGGIFSAIAVMCMLIGGLIPIGTYAAPIFAGICLLPIAIDIGAKWAVLCYLGISSLSAIIVPDKELLLFFIFLLGYYPIIHPILNKIPYAFLRYLVKFIIFNAAIFAVYSLLLFIFVSPVLQEELANFGVWYWGVLYLGGITVLFLYDAMLDKVRFLYIHSIRKHILR